MESIITQSHHRTHKAFEQGPAIKVGISQCLLGANVRFDGGHRLNRYCVNILSELFQFIPLCPEMGIGMPAPRQTLRLVDLGKGVRAVFSDDSKGDFTESLSQFADDNIHKLDRLSGYILCKASPSCGMERVKIYNEKGGCEKKGIGIFASRLMELYPDLPVEEDGRLNDTGLRDSFIKRIYIYHEWQQLRQLGLTPNRIQHFHSKHKLLLLSHCQQSYRHAGPLVASITKKNLEHLAPQYFSMLMQGLKKVASRCNNTNVLMHMQGFLKKQIDSADRQELARVISEYRIGQQPLLSAITLLKHHLQRHPDCWLQAQSWLDPYPASLAIRASQ